MLKKPHTNAHVAQATGKINLIFHRGFSCASVVVSYGDFTIELWSPENVNEGKKGKRNNKYQKIRFSRFSLKTVTDSG